MVDFACLYERFDPAVPLDATDPVYVDWQQEVSGADVKRQLENCILLSTREHSHRLFTGLRGGGKTTELRRVAEMLRNGTSGKRFFVSFLDADDTLALDDVDPTDLVLAIVRQLVTDLKTADIPIKADRKLKAFLVGMGEALDAIGAAGADLKAGDPWGIVELSTTLKRQPTIRRQVRKLLEGRMESLYDGINDELLPAIRGQLASLGMAGIVVIVDQLDRMSPEGERHHRVFWEGRGKLRALNCHVVYTAPIEYAYSRAAPTLESEYGELVGLPLLPTSAADPAIRAAAQSCTRDVVLELKAPLHAIHMSQVVGRLAAKYLDPLEEPEREVALLVHKTKAKPTDDRQLELFYGLLRDQFVFSYAVGEDRWYDWNPLLERSRLGRA